MRQQATSVAFFVAFLGLAAGIPFYAQEHSEHQAAPARSGGAGMENSQSVF